ncbi:hypothetical protein VTJ83DRAFT_1881 [Remersonia thermophila]|uniref:Uncharacterized protein n=1 Tax=Remersonia thermophila TaxID=72144 RepID=A0ABR4DHG7_9PEZI
MPLSMPRSPSLTAPRLVELGLRWVSASQKRWSTMALQWSVLHLMALAVLVLFPFLLDGGEPTTTATATTNLCTTTHDLHNPLAERFPNNATGVLNATLAIIPIPLETARRLIPSQWSILEHAYRALLPDFPEGMYPVMLQAAHDHDVQLRAYGITLDDFSRVGFEFPFIDLTGDGYSSFRWAPAQLITAGHDIALEGSRAYGTIVSPASYDPPCDAYRRLPSGATYFRGTTQGLASPPSSTPATKAAGMPSPAEFIELEMHTLATGAAALHLTTPYPLEFFKNITNQPTFANASTCDNMIRLFNTTMSTGKYAPVAVRGRVRARAFPFVGHPSSQENMGSYGLKGGQQAVLTAVGRQDDDVHEWTDVYGVQIATPFIENNYLDCRTMRGYTGTGGPADSIVV